MGIEVTHCHRQMITYDGESEHRAQVVMVAARQGNVFSRPLFFLLVLFFGANEGGYGTQKCSTPTKQGTI
jgi:hypothetical protein